MNKWILERDYRTFSLHTHKIRIVILCDEGQNFLAHSQSLHLYGITFATEKKKRENN